MIGNRTRVKVVKNKVAPPFKMAEFDIMYGEGISKAGDVLDCAVEAGILDKSGAWYSYKDNRIGQGRENVKSYLNEHPEMLEELQQEITHMYIKPSTAMADDEIGLPVDEDGVILDD